MTADVRAIKVSQANANRFPRFPASHVGCGSRTGPGRGESYRVTEQQARAARTRRTLLRSAAVLFDRHGYHATTLQDISAGAGVSPGALHFHFENKAAVAQAVEETGADLLWSAGKIAYRHNTRALQALTDISHALAALLRWDVLARAGFRLGSDSARSGSRVLVQDWHACVERLLAEATRNGELGPRTQQDSVICTIVTATMGIGLLTRSSTDVRPQDALTAFWRVFLPELARPEVASRLRPAGTGHVVAAAVSVSASVPARERTPQLLAPPA